MRFRLPLIACLLALPAPAQVSPFGDRIVPPETAYGATDVGDLDGDGTIDLLMIRDEYQWVRSTKEGELLAPLLTNADRDTDQDYVGLADIDRDGDLDIVYHTADEIVVLFKMPGDGNYERRTVATPEFSLTLADIGDFDGDGAVDIVTVSVDANRVQLVRNRGDGRFDEPEVIAEAGSGAGMIPRVPIPMAVGDFDGDGRLDIAGQAGVLGELWQLRNTPSGFEPLELNSASVVDLRPDALLAGDVDGDGDDDLVFGGVRGGTGRAGFVEMRGETGVIRSFFESSESALYFRMTLGDFDLDGDLDLVRNGPYREGLYYHEFRRGNFGSGIEIESPGENWSRPRAAADIDGDGDPDLVMESVADGGGSAVYPSLAINDPVIRVFEADADRISQGESVMLSWHVSLADSVRIDPVPGEVSREGMVEVTPSTTTTYELTAVRDGNELTESITVEVFVDSDGDGLEDSWEEEYFGDLLQGADGDPDDDGLDNLREYREGTDPDRGDSDGDALSDLAELDVHGSDPLSGDSDGDGAGDALEVAAGTSPLSAAERPSAFLDELAIYSPFDEVSEAGAIPNLARPESAGSLAGGSIGNDGLFGGALEMTGAANQGVVYQPGPTSNDGSVVASIWFRVTDGSTGGAIVSGGEAGDPGRWSIRLSGDQVRFHVGEASRGLSGVVSGDWHHALLGISSGGAFSGFLDGEETETVSGVPTGISLERVSVGAPAGGGSAFAGALDEFALWRRDLSSPEIDALGTAPGLGIATPGIAGPPALPVIEESPSGGELYTGQSATLQVGVSGLQPFSYQWWWGDDKLDGETSATLVLEEPAPGDSGDYRVSVGNLAGSVESAAASLVVVDPEPQLTAELSELPSFINSDIGGVDICGDLLAVGVPSVVEPGEVIVYSRNEGGRSNWGELARITAPADVVNPNGFGGRVVIDRGRLAVGPESRQRGAAVHLYEQRNGRFERVARIPGNADDASFGIDLDLYGDTLVASASQGEAGEIQSGRVHLYQRQPDGSWLRKRTLASDSGTRDDGYGFSVSLFDDTLAVAAPGDSVGADDSGAVYLYERDLGGENRWGERQKLKPSGNQRFVGFGAAVSLFGDTLAVGVHPDDDTFRDVVFHRSGPDSGWTRQQDWTYQMRDRVSDRTRDSLALSGDHLAVARPADAQLVLRRRIHPGNGSWQEVDPTIAPPQQEFEDDLAMSGDVVFIEPSFVYEQPAVAPFIKHHPVSRSAFEGDQEEFEVYGLGSPPLKIQWLKDGAAIPGETGTSLKINAVEAGDFGEYRARITNAYGETESRAAILERERPPTIVEQPDGPARQDDGSVTIGVDVSGTGLSYQWFFEGEPIDGADGSVLHLDSPGPGDVGRYSVRVSNALGTVTSEPVGILLEDLVPLQLAQFIPQGLGNVGAAVDLDGGRAIIGAPGVDPAGAAFVYEFDIPSGEWLEVARLSPSPDGQGNQDFGASVAIEGSLAVVGAPRTAWTEPDEGASYVFRRRSPGDGSGVVWERVATLSRDPESRGRQGLQVAIHGDEVFASSFDSLQRFVENSDGDWVEAQVLRARVAGDGFGESLAVRDGLLVMGVQRDNAAGSNAGAVRVYEKLDDGSGDWAETAKLLPSSPRNNGMFGASVTVREDTIAVGEAPFGINPPAGSVHVYERNGSGWGRGRRLQPEGLLRTDSFGTSLALGDGRLVVGASGDGARGVGAGVAYMFEREEGDWQMTRELFADDAGPQDAFGHSLDVDHGSLLVGALRAAEDGSAYLFQMSPDVLDVEVSGEPTLNRQTGLYEQQVVVRNESTAPVPAMELQLGDLPDGMQLYNGGGESGSLVRFDRSVAGLDTVEIVLEFFVADRGSPETPTLSVAGALESREAATGGDFRVIELVRRVSDGAMLVEFASEPGKRYRIQYSDDMETWRDAGPVIQAAGTRVQWIDHGPPKTIRHPEVVASRYYRVLESDD